MSASSLSESIIGESEPIRRLRELVVRLAPADIPVLIEGPTGAGKELVAEALHRLSGRAGAYVPFNVCAIAEGMVEDELFGHVRGAYTGASTTRTGYLAAAHGGTAFFDEIGGLAMGVQAKLLRAVETRRFRRVGDDREQFSDFRAVAATNEPVDERVRAGRFRGDLLYRLNGFRLTVPALRDRADDIPLLARTLLTRLAGADVSLSVCAVRALQNHDWPGNVRELRRVLEAATILAMGNRITSREITSNLQQHIQATESQDDLERRRILKLLDETGWDIPAVANATEVHPATVYRWLQRLMIRIPKRMGRRCSDHGHAGAIAGPPRR